MKKQNKGFTLIELLVVIAIIGILASVVLVSLGSARQKGQDAKVQEQMANLRASAEIYAGNQASPSYGSFSYGDCSTGSTGSIFGDTASGGKAIVDATLSAAGSASGVAKCYASTKAWAMATKLPSGTNYWCVDSTGISKLGTGTTLPTTFSDSSLCPQ